MPKYGPPPPLPVALALRCCCSIKNTFVLFFSPHLTLIREEPALNSIIRNAPLPKQWISDFAHASSRAFGHPLQTPTFGFWSLLTPMVHLFVDAVLLFVLYPLLGTWGVGFVVAQLNFGEEYTGLWSCKNIMLKFKIWRWRSVGAKWILCSVNV